MASLFSKDEIIATAFTRKINVDRIPDRLIESVQTTHIKPIIKSDFYDAIVASPLSYSALLVYLLPVVAYFVKYYILPEIWNDISASGINKIPGNNRATSNTEDYFIAKDSALENANLHAKALTDYLNDNTDLYPLYYMAVNPYNKTKNYGGILFDGNKSDLYGDDDCYITT